MQELSEYIKSLSPEDREQSFKTTTNETIKYIEVKKASRN